MTDTTAKPRVRRPAGSSVTVGDGLVNVLTGVGTTADKSSYSRYAMRFVDHYQIEAAYRTSGLCRKIHDVPCDEETREGRDWQAKPDQIEALELAERRLGVWDKIRLARVTARLFGGAALIMGLPGDSATKALVPSLGSLRYLFVVSRHQINVGPLDSDVNSAGFGEPLYYEMTSGNTRAKIHPSRVIPFKGQPVPLGAAGHGNAGFWGDPLLMGIETAIKNVESTHGNVAALVQEAKIDTLTIPGLTSMVATSEGEAQLSRRLTVAQQFQSILNTRMIDGGVQGGEAEKWETRQLSWTGLPDITRAFQVFLSGVVDIPYTRLFGESPGGMNSTGKGEQVDFHKKIRSGQKTELRPLIERLDEYLIPSALGSRPSDVYWEFAPLADSDPTEIADIEKKAADTVKVYADAQVVPDTVLAKMTRNRLIESGAWPGVEGAYAEADAAGDVAPISEEPEDDPSAAVPVSQGPVTEPPEVIA